MMWEICHNREQRTTQTSKNFSPSSHTCAFETAVVKFFTSINLYPSLSSVLKVYSSSELFKRSSSSAYFFFFLEEPKVPLGSKSESWFSTREVLGVEEAISSTTAAVSSYSSSVFAFQKNFSFFSSCRQIYFSLQSFSITSSLICYSVWTECYTFDRNWLFIPRKTVQIRLHQVSLIKSRLFGAWLPE